MLASIYYKRSLFNAHTMILIVYIFISVNKLCLNQTATVTTITATATTATATTMNLFRSCFIRVTLRYLVTGVTRFSPFLQFMFCSLEIHVVTLTVTACCVAELRWSCHVIAGARLWWEPVLVLVTWSELRPLGYRERSELPPGK